MRYTIDEDKIYDLIDAEVSFAADGAYDEQGNSLYDGITLTTKDKGWVRRFISDAVARLVGRLSDIARFSSSGKSSTASSGSSDSSARAVTASASSSVQASGEGANGRSARFMTSLLRKAVFANSIPLHPTENEIYLDHQYEGDDSVFIPLIRLGRDERDSFGRLSMNKTDEVIVNMTPDAEGAFDVYDLIEFSTDDTRTATYYHNAIAAGMKVFRTAFPGQCVFLTVNVINYDESGAEVMDAKIIGFRPQDIAGISSEPLHSVNSLRFTGFIYHELTASSDDAQQWLPEYINGEETEYGSPAFVNGENAILAYLLGVNYRNDYPEYTYPDYAGGSANESYRMGTINMGLWERTAYWYNNYYRTGDSGPYIQFKSNLEDEKKSPYYPWEYMVSITKREDAPAGTQLSWSIDKKTPSWFRMLQDEGDPRLLTFTLLADNPSSSRRSFRIPITITATVGTFSYRNVIFIDVVQEGNVVETDKEPVAIAADSEYLLMGPESSEKIIGIMVGSPGMSYFVKLEYEDGDDGGWLSGNKTNGGYRVLCEENQGEERRAYLTFKPANGDDSSVLVTVIQLAYGSSDLYINLESQRLELGYNAVTRSIHYEVPVGSKVSVSAEGQDWLRALVASDGSIAIIAAENSLVYSRSAKVLMWAELRGRYVETSITVIQDARPSDSGSGTSQDVSLSYTADDGMDALDSKMHGIAIYCEYTEGARLSAFGSAQWLQIGSVVIRDSSHCVVQLSVGENTGPERTGSVTLVATLGDKSTSAAIAVRQAAPEEDGGGEGGEAGGGETGGETGLFLQFLDTPENLGADDLDDGMHVLFIACAHTAGAQITARTGDTWLEVQGIANAGGTEKLVQLLIYDNTAMTPRTAELTVTATLNGESISKTMTITQNGRETPWESIVSMTIGEFSLFKSTGAAAQTCRLATMNVSTISLLNVPGWLSARISGDESTGFSLAVEPSDNGVQERTGSFTLLGENAAGYSVSKLVSVTQAAKPTVRPASEKVTFGYDETEFKDIACPWSGSRVDIRSSSPVVTWSLMEGEMLRIWMEANETTKAREYTLTLTASNNAGESETAQIKVAQTAGIIYDNGDDSGNGGGDGDALPESGEGAADALDFNVPDFDPNKVLDDVDTAFHADGLFTGITRYIVLASCTRIFQDRYAPYVSAYAERTQLAMDNIENIIRQRKAPTRE